LYNHKFLNSCGTGILPVSFIQIKCTTAYQENISRKVTALKTSSFFPPTPVSVAVHKVWR